ncbi:SAICAR synthase-like protein [Macrolepiota fuliginosa MF-IS2]|uniref:Kinase n=1 Tax=Macrolepiota fuliginosa MF-IS2 TaxID=1400762 RepID=A0A9P5X0T7_9AGAR|nr:SAICAR synthase-like protein [Macrolepiota fuliginosa MF-IS2]
MSLEEGLNTVSLETQVGGHAGVLTTEDGELLIKPALPRELEFYQKLQADNAFAALRPYTPRFIGTLRLEGELDQSKPQEEGIAVKSISDKKESIVLENISHRFSKPNILDVKLGTILYDDGASPEKVTRMLETARNTTSLETGVRLTGFQVYDNVTGKAINTPKSYGKTIKAADLPEGVAKFFPVGAPVTSPTGSSSGLPAHLLRPVIEGIREEIQEIRNVFAELELRMVGGSLLVVYEADWTRAEEGLKNLGCDDEEDEEEETDEESKEKPGPPFIVKLIDFAHTKTVPGAGADEGVLLGMDTVLKLLDARLKQLVSL